MAEMNAGAAVIDNFRWRRQMTVVVISVIYIALCILYVVFLHGGQQHSSMGTVHVGYS